MLEKCDGSLTTDDAEAATILNDYFCSVYTRENMSDFPSFTLQHLDSHLSSITVTYDEVFYQLSKLQSNKSEGPDQCHPFILKSISEGIVIPLTCLFNKSLEEGVLPNSWKEATVIALHKKGSKHQASNYRPVSLTSVVGKMLEAIVKDHIMYHLTTNNLLSDYQHGFRQGRSCSSQLLRVADMWTRSLDNKQEVDIIFLDLQKAFDKVPYERLLIKLSAYGIVGPLLSWIRNFLYNRRQRVRVRATYSSWSSVLSGVPQGSVLGPLLFILYVNDLPDEVQSSLWLFADDSKMFRSITTVEDSVQLQNDINLLLAWCYKWQMSFNNTKCRFMTVGRISNARHYTMDTYSGDFSIPITEEETDLGVVFNKNLKFTNHVSHCVRKANRILGIINHTFRKLNPHIFRLLYVSLVRPHLEYASPVWNPHLLKDIRALESVQRRATRLVPEFRVKSYHERLVSLNLPSLQYRRKLMDMIMTYKIINGLVGIRFSDLFSYGYVTTRSNGYKLLKQSCSSNQRLHSFSLRVVNDWNSLPADVVSAPDVASFKKLLDKFWSNYHYIVD